MATANPTSSGDSTTRAAAETTRSKVRLSIAPVGLQLLESLAGVVELGVGLRKTEPDHVAAGLRIEERRPGNARHARLRQQVHRLLLAGLARQPRRIGEHVVRPLRDIRCQPAPLECCAESVALLPELGAERRIVLVAELLDASRDAYLQRRR